jgi:predicted metal-dependent hydrolase
MKREVKIDNKKLAYSIKKSKRAKRIRVAVYCDGSVVITSPQYTLEKTIIRFLHLKSDWVFKKIDFFSKLEVHPDIATTSQRHFIQHKDAALSIVKERVEYFSKRHNFTPNIVRVKMLKTKWGSCSVKKNLNFNYKVLFLSGELRDYVIIHELCHLKVMNHSQQFWNEIKKHMPNYLDFKSELQSKGFSH